MKLQLLIEGSAATLASILANLPADAAVSAPQPLPGDTITGANSGAVASIVPMPQPSASPIPPMPSAPTGGDDGDDDSGPVQPVADGVVDTNGMPWDERIHAKTKATNADGSWRYRRGVDDATKTAVEAELRARSAPPMPGAPSPLPVAPPMPVPAPVNMGNGAEGAAPVPNPVPMPQPVPHQHHPVPQPAPQPMPQPVPAPIPQPMPQPAPEPVQTAVATATGALDFAQFMQHLSGQMTKRDGAGAPLVHADYLAGITNEIAGAFQQPLSAITDIAANPQMITYAVQCMQRDGRW